MKRATVWLGLLMGLAAPLGAQYRHHKHFFTAGGGAGVPSGDLKRYLSDSPAFRFNYGYRFHRFFQVDTGLDVVFYAADVNDYYESQVGDLRIRDYQYFVPLGGRTILPLAGDRVLLSFGGGGAYVRYQESIRQPFGEYGPRVECPPCRSRSGWGYYGLIGGSVALDRRKMLRLGVTSQVYRAETSGDAFGGVPPVRTKDKWVNTMAELTVSF
ncbi:MAG: hypothetical protein JJE04_10345 [Acidobacteriia bacterium]|nr:hypothetical protein [Terriglobia bacterium]